MARIAVFVLLLSIIGLALGASDALARGWGDDIFHIFLNTFFLIFISQLHQ